jgi:hypothetical protein
VTYRYDYHDARSHSARARAEPGRYPAFSQVLRVGEADPDAAWVRPTPAEMAETSRAVFVERFHMALDDLRLVPRGVVVIAEGWGLRPELVAPLLASPDRAIFLVPTREFRDRQLSQLERAGRLGAAGLSDPARAQRNRVERDEILARDVVDSAAQHGLRVLQVDGSRDAPAVAELVEEQFGPFLPRWLY